MLSSSANTAAAAVLESHVLHFLVYVPAADKSPLLLLGPKGKVRNSNSFWIPSWGGVLVLNLANEIAAASTDTAEFDHDEGDSEGGQSRLPWQPLPLQQQHYQHIAAVVIAQLQALFGVAPGTSSSSSSSSTGAVQLQQLPAGAAGFSQWQVDALLRQRAGADVREATRVLGSLSRLVQQLPNLEMPDLIGQQVEQALSDIRSAWQHIAAGDYHAAGAAAAAAQAAAEAAFLHPSVLAQLNFPDSHKLGVYMPLFLPVSVPLLQGFVLQLRHYLKRRREYGAALRASG